MFTDFLTVDGWLHLGISVGVFALFIGLRKVFTTYVFKFFLRFAERRNINTAANIMLALEKPFRWLIVLIGIFIALHYFPFEPISDTTEKKLFRSTFIVLASWSLMNLSSIATLLFPKIIKKLDMDVDQIIMPFITKIINVIIFALAVSIIAEEWGFNVNGFVAGLGLGGLAFALAAKETLSNLFGGIVIVTEKPFTIGDWIKTPSVEGTVEDITFRSTKIRTFAQALVTVPNSTLSNEPIINWSKMGKRQIAFHLGLSYDTPKKKLEQVITRIEDMLIRHDQIHPDTILVKFDQFNDSSLDVYLYFFTNLTDFAGHLNIKEDINFQIMEILEEENVSIAFPTRTLIVQSDSMENKPELENARGLY
ncbi:mechanosensitive ion channel family protein [Peribacillus cavernae]|uniref:mechanosensitive ion channel family protein n=1 Tax=Peribacillus cavernae TaxID=1674310 RepID=UPI001FE969AB|nr:mechanosensitive ion channel family protein [Peribacillus cavernae]MDQ0217896.1 MscS family membrane protein [Peribacillus cavernae]